jgi:UDP-N-acetylmuramate dehydrogenase
MDAIQHASAALRDADIPFVENEPLKLHTTFRIGGAAAVFCTPQTVAQLVAVFKTARLHVISYYVLGHGSNVLFADEGYAGMIIHPSGELKHIAVSENEIRAGAGASLKAVCETAQAAGLSGLEFAYGIPGSVGGAVYMNAGAYGGEIRQVLERVVLLDESLRTHERTGGVLELGYRDSVFQHCPWAILSAVFSLVPKSGKAIRERMEHHMAQRQKKQPLEYPSAGSAFIRPKGAYASELIDRCGLRGARVGDAAVSEKHCGFIVNLGRATCRDVLALANHVADTVMEKTGFVLEKEIRVVENPVSE